MIRRWGVVVSLGAAACSTFNAGGDAPAPAPPAQEAGVSADAGAADALGDASVSDAPEAGDADSAPACKRVVTAASLEADTLLTTGSCAQAVSAGGLTNMNVTDTHVSLVRFMLDPQVEDALKEGRVESMTLEIAENPTCDGICGVNAHVPGTFTAHPMRTDWAEGPVMYVDYSGADLCRRTAGNPGAGWGGAAMAGAATAIAPDVDYLYVAAGSVTTVAADKKLTFALDPAKAGFPTREPNKLAFLLRRPVGSTGKFFGAQRQSAAHPAATLAITLCAK